MGAGASLGSNLLNGSRTPAQWCEEFAERGVPISERLLRAKARQLGAYYSLGAAMLITPAQIDQILEDSQCRSKRTAGAAPGGQKAGSKSTGARSRSTSVKALDHLRNAALKTGSANAKRGKSAGTM